ncbi:LysE family translocator [Pelosinus sp. UFO1]|uniref:LysE family translocator n=1 Tax=Pelosinus sp. UFO1 TaxID=484770 RepID=UPI0004D0B8CA|nr:LysE family translocator [Pelosinus sp. UFO1]AIF50621.1 Lysine exporter protein (LYSE/YGGA) [Pelosinus sp. UFO1]
MLGIQNYEMFLLAGIVLNITPGSDTIYILSRSVAQGKRGGIYSVFGIISGVAIHTIMAALGLSAILSTSATAFAAVKMIGAMYLGYLGLTTLLAKENKLISLTDTTHMTPRNIYFQGLITNVLNPKVALFFLSFLPQFIAPSNTYGLLPFLCLGITFIITGTTWCLLLVLFSSRMSAYLRENEKTAFITNKVCGTIYLGLGVKLLTAEK